MTMKNYMNQKRHKFGITYDDYNKEVYVFGGEDNEDVINHCEKYCVSKDKWTQLEPMSK